MSSKVDGALRSQVQRELARSVASAGPASNPEVDALREAAQLKSERNKFRQSLVADAKAFGVRAPSQKKFESAQRYKRLLRKAQRLGTGKRLRKGPIELRVSAENVRYKKQGAFVKSRHTVLTIRNVGKAPLAYNIAVEAANRGRCRVKGTRPHNTIALRPNQSAKITVCAGKTQVRVAKLETLDVSALGYHYLSQLPPRALGVDASRSSAHVVPGRRSLCANVSQGAHLKALRSGASRWDDIVDFYSRHDCRRFQMPAGYRRARKKIARFPVLSSK